MPKSFERSLSSNFSSTFYNQHFADRQYDFPRTSNFSSFPSIFADHDFCSTSTEWRVETLDGLPPFV